MLQPIDSPAPVPLPPDVKLALESTRKNAIILKSRLEQLTQLHQHFSTPNKWPEIVEMFVVLARTQYHALQENLSLLFKEHLIKPRSLYNIDPGAIPELLRTRMEPEIEKEQKALVSEYTKTENFNPEEYDNNIELTRISIEKHNKMIDELLVQYEGLTKSLIEATKKDLVTSNIVMPDVNDKLILYYNAINHGQELCTQPEIEIKESEMDMRRVKKPVLSDGEKQKELLEQSRKRKLEKTQAQNLQAAAMSNPMPAQNPVPSKMATSTISIQNLPTHIKQPNPTAILTPGAAPTTPILPPTGIQPYQNLNRGLGQYPYQNVPGMNPMQPNMRGGIPGTANFGVPIVSGYPMAPQMAHRGIPVPGVPAPGQVPQMMGGPQNPIPVSGQSAYRPPSGQKKR
eukprot:TRINITY_DN4054_c0_g1_i1.p1 TRINITY_DN4054_c0_g1~~TRINITY_DN4054_c0_g1_i1.p1  ORF type:complete len:400 (-),score=126.07 TRINITY_DN4054_c0_g1_i1:111-1310(-)